MTSSKAPVIHPKGKMLVAILRKTNRDHIIVRKSIKSNDHKLTGLHVDMLFIVPHYVVFLK